MSSKDRGMVQGCSTHKCSKGSPKVQSSDPARRLVRQSTALLQSVAQDARSFRKKCKDMIHMKDDPKAKRKRSPSTGDGLSGRRKTNSWVRPKKHKNGRSPNSELPRQHHQAFEAPSQLCDESEMHVEEYNNALFMGLLSPSSPPSEKTVKGLTTELSHSPNNVQPHIEQRLHNLKGNLGTFERIERTLPGITETSSGERSKPMAGMGPSQSSSNYASESPPSNLRQRRGLSRKQEKRRVNWNDSRGSDSYDEEQNSQPSQSKSEDSRGIFLCPWIQCDLPQGRDGRGYELHRLKEHINRQHLKPFECPICHLEKGDKAQYKAHFEKSHPNKPLQDHIVLTRSDLKRLQFLSLKHRKINYETIKAICTADSLDKLRRFARPEDLERSELDHPKKPVSTIKDAVQEFSKSKSFRDLLAFVDDQTSLHGSSSRQEVLNCLSSLCISMSQARTDSSVEDPLTVDTQSSFSHEIPSTNVNISPSSNISSATTSRVPSIPTSIPTIAPTQHQRLEQQHELPWHSQLRFTGRQMQPDFLASSPLISDEQTSNSSTVKTPATSDFIANQTYALDQSSMHSMGPQPASQWAITSRSMASDVAYDGAVSSSAAEEPVIPQLKKTASLRIAPNTPSPSGSMSAFFDFAGFENQPTSNSYDVRSWPDHGNHIDSRFGHLPTSTPDPYAWQSDPEFQQ